jgi:hypothetical protein
MLSEGLTTEDKLGFEQWKRLLYFSNDNISSQAIQNNFFLSPEGSKNPQSELNAFLKLIKDKEWQTICHFPARYQWVKKYYPEIIDNEFNLKTHCPKTWTFLEQVKGISTGVVFASYYVNNPASIFGHTFLYVSKTPVELGNSNTPYEMLDSAVSYGADTGDANALHYFFGGLMGGFHGTTSVLPYFVQVRLYNNFESRDLWKFYLNFTPEETDFLVRHLWELNLARFPYYFLSKNCSYQLLAILDIVRPNLELTKKIPFYVIPVDTIRLLEKENLIVKSEFSPSARHKFYSKQKTLSNEEKHQLNNLINQKTSLDHLSIDSQRKVLDAAIDYFDFRYAKQVLGEDPDILKLKNPILVKRAKLGGTTSEITAHQEAINPASGHPSGRVSLAVGRQFKEELLKFNYRFAAHDLLDPSRGYLANSTLEVGDLQFQLKKNQLEIQKVTALHFATLDPWREWRRPISWSMRFGGERYQNRNGQSWFDTGLYPQAGLSLSSENMHTTIFALAGPIFAHRYKNDTGHTHHLGIFGAEATIGSMFTWERAGKFLMQYQIQSFSDDDVDQWELWSLSFQSNILKNQSNLFVKIDWIDSFHRSQTPNWEFGINHYF